MTGARPYAGRYWDTEAREWVFDPGLSSPTRNPTKAAERRLCAMATVLWGERWIIPASIALGINERTLERIHAADRMGVPCDLTAGVLRAFDELLSQVSALGGDRP